MADNVPKVLVFAGSLRKDSYNKKLARLAAEAARAAGAQVTLIDLKEFPLPVYDGDLEAADGLPESARRLRALMIESDGCVIATPEYNKGVPGPLKNALDWASRGERGEGELSPFEGKAAALMSASPGRLGGVRAVDALRLVLSNIGVLVIPETVSVAAAYEAFDENGALKDERRREAVEGVSRALVGLLRALRTGAGPASRSRSARRRRTPRRGSKPALRAR